MFIVGIIIIALALCMSGYHAWMQGGGPVPLKYSYATILMLVAALIVVLGWAFAGVPK